MSSSQHVNGVPLPSFGVFYGVARGSAIGLYEVTCELVHTLPHITSLLYLAEACTDYKTDGSKYASYLICKRTGNRWLMFDEDFFSAPMPGDFFPFQIASQILDRLRAGNIIVSPSGQLFYRDVGGVPEVIDGEPLIVQITQGPEGVAVSKRMQALAI